MHDFGTPLLICSQASPQIPTGLKLKPRKTQTLHKLSQAHIATFGPLTAPKEPKQLYTESGLCTWRVMGT